MIKVSKELCRSYKGSYHVFYVDHFYTSADKVKKMKTMDLYVNGTVMSNRIPEQLRMIKCSREFKEMERGDHKIYVCLYKTDDGENSKIGLVCWKDKDIVCCLTNSVNTENTAMNRTLLSSFTRL